MSCAVAELDPITARPATVWRRLVKNNLVASRTSATLAIEDGDHLRVYLNVLDEFERAADNAAKSVCRDNDWYTGLISRIAAILVSPRENSASAPTDAPSPEPPGFVIETSRAVLVRYGERFARRILEIFIVALCVPGLNVNVETEHLIFEDKDLDELCEVFRYFGFSLPACAERLDRLLDRHDFGPEMDTPQQDQQHLARAVT